MSDFMIRFLMCNIFLSGIIGILLAIKRIFKNHLSSRMQYNLWFLLLGLMAVPFLPVSPIGLSRLLSWFEKLRSFSVFHTETILKETIHTNAAVSANWRNDFALSVNSGSYAVIGYLLFCVWMIGILAMVVWILKSHLHLHALKKSALPLQNQEARRLYHLCLKEAGVTKDIPVCSTAFLTSPVIAGLLKPCIYLPIHLISDYKESDMRYMLLHELQHYKHKDALAGYLMNFAGILYWFNPFVRYALKEMRNDREVACDTSVLEMLDEDSYEDYGNTLINFAEKISHTPFPFAAGLGGTAKQIKRRILNIASYEKPTLGKRLKGITVFVLTAALLFGVSPILSTYAANANYYQWKTASKQISDTDLSAYFGNYEGSFVLYNLKDDTWSIHNLNRALLRVSPDSTYKIYTALFGLEEGIISPKDSFLAWNGDIYPFPTWNRDQTLTSAMQSSVNWYFQEIDKQLGSALVSDYIRKIGYGNETITGDFSTYWLESSLQISPIEQIELLTKFYNNTFGFSPENIRVVKDALFLSSSETGTFYGKTGTGRINDKDVNGWFTGFAETADNTYFFAANIGADSGASGSKAAEIAVSILTDMNILNR